MSSEYIVLNANENQQDSVEPVEDPILLSKNLSKLMKK